VVVDPPRESLDLVNAGHPPPVVIPPDGEPRLLPLQGNVALGTTSLTRYKCETHPLPTGSAVLLYTDGLVERRGESIDRGLERMMALARGVTNVEALCMRLVEHLAGGHRRDDVALIAARALPPPDRLSGGWPADRESLVAVRHDLRRWLAALGARRQEVFDITVAAQEACANAVEHAYRPGPEAFQLEATCEDRLVRVVVRDTGRWRPPRGTNRGRGMLLMSELMDSVDIRHTEGGTEVVLERELAHAEAA
jgi:anti-sigma regulatory factor (Ser/Thr protein kinase)